jgi:hypothetical protein
MHEIVAKKTPSLAYDAAIDRQPLGRNLQTTTHSDVRARGGVMQPSGDMTTHQAGAEPAFGSAITTAADVEAWCAGAALEFGDPSEPVCQLFFHFERDFVNYQGEALVCGWSDGGMLMLLFGAAAAGGALLPVPVRAGNPIIAPTGELEAFGATPITGDVWALSPSLNVPGALHGFVVLYNVPTPAPWQTLLRGR